MIEIILNIAIVLLESLPLVLLCFYSKRVNLPKPDRSKQFLMPGVALLYVILAMLLLNPLNEWLLKVINSIPLWLARGASTWMPKLASVLTQWNENLSGISWWLMGICTSLLKFSFRLKQWLAQLNLQYWVFFISNLVILLVYLLLKRICLAIMARRVKVDGAIHEKVAGLFYEYFPERNKWCLKENYVQVRGMLKVFFHSAIVLSTVLVVISRSLYYGELVQAVFYPVFGIIIVGELFFYLDGATKREYSGHILGEDEDAYKTVNYSLLRKFLRSVFGDKLLAENTSINNALDYTVTTDELIRDLEKREDQKIVSFASYLDALNKTGFQLDHNYLRSSLDLMEGKSVLFNNPFYNDLIPYAFYPMNRALLQHQKVLVVLGRHSIEEDISQWLEKGIGAVTNIPFLWNIGVLNSEAQDLDIGIITRSDVLDIELHEANAEFLEKVGFCVIIEPSKLLATAQIGLNLIVKKCQGDKEERITYCMCDKNCDGLVDAMSHVLMTSITEVSATKKHQGTSSYMCWEADDEYLHHRLVPNISRYLGMGTELSFAALKNQVSKTKWYGGEAFPVTDMRWIDKQYYYELTKYASLPTNQEAMDEHFIATANFWSAQVEKNSYTTVEDESHNMFEILRDFSTRATEQGFINIISSEYLLKDYMVDNASIFEADAKAIPNIVSDYTRSNRNTILRLVLMMSKFPVCEETLTKELSLLGITVFDLKMQLWYELYNCYSKVADTAALSDDYRQAVHEAYSRTICLDNAEWSHAIIKEKESFNLKSGRVEITYTISDDRFLKRCVSELRSASYVAEDEKGQRYYLGTELGGHIYQKYLPGQFFTFGGKYYQMQYLTADGQILVRRAADHISGRPSYRQMREYVIHGVKSCEKIGSRQDVGGMKVIKEFADISVSTPGYYRMDKYNDFATSKKVCFEGEKSGIPKRLYRNKEILRVELPDFDGKLNDNIRYTIATLFNEVFKTLFAENQAYICAVTDASFLAEDCGDKPQTYSLRGDGYQLQKNAIYIIEDSQLDLGLTVAVERNLQRIFDIVQDYLTWHMQALEFSLNPPAEPEPPVEFTETQEPEPEKGIKGFFRKIKRGIKKVVDKVKGWFKRKKKNSPEEEVPTDDQTPVAGDVPTNGETPAEEPVAEEPATEEPAAEEPVTEEPAAEEPAAEEETPAEAEDGEMVEQEPAETTEAPGSDTCGYAAGTEGAEEAPFAERKPYHQRYYMLYGRDYEPAGIDLSGTLHYLAAMSKHRNPLKQAREGKDIAAFIEATFRPGKPDARYCDFCGTEIYGVEYETLADGRDRCLHCSRTAIKTGEEFRKIFEDVKRNMEAFFGIRINAGIKVEMVNAKTLHKRLKRAFIPTPNSDGRVLGVAISDRNGYTLMVENGSPRMASMLTMAHELTHIWQYINWDDKAIRKKYGKKMRLEIYEGMAKWVEIQYAYLLNEPATAKREEIMTSYRDDEYGRGFLRYRANYPFSLGTVITKRTPFLDVNTPLDPAFCGPMRVTLPTNGINPGDVAGSASPGAGRGTPKPQEAPVLPTGVLKGPAERNPDALNRYAYGLLGEGEKAVYDAVLEAINAFAPEMTQFGMEITDTQLKKIVDWVQRDHPELIWFQHGGTYHFDKTTRIVSKLELSYCMTQEQAQVRQAEIAAQVQSFMESVTDAMSDYEVTLRIYENLIRQVDYDTVGLERQKRTTVNAEVPDDLRSIYGVFVNKKAVCAGYAKAMQYLLNRSGIECAYVTSDTHAWNLVKLEGDYYHMDVTWGDESDTKRQAQTPDAINYDCFCITTQELARLESHTPDGNLPLPECTATACNYHRRHGLYLEEYDYDMVRSIVCERVKQQQMNISLKFGSPEALLEARQQLVDAGKFKEVIQLAALKAETKLNPGYVYSVREDKLTMAFFITKL